MTDSVIPGATEFAARLIALEVLGRPRTRSEVIWAANAFALLGLGSLLTVVDMLVRRFRYLDETIRAHPRLRDQDPRR